MVQTTKELCIIDNHPSPIDSNPNFLLWSIDKNAAKKIKKPSEIQFQQLPDRKQDRHLRSRGIMNNETPHRILVNTARVTTSNPPMHEIGLGQVETETSRPKRAL